MKASLKWIKEILPALEATPESVEQKLTDVGIEVEDVVRQAAGLEHIVTAEVRKLEQHPQADRLRLATIFDGSQEHDVVCGAPNIEVGQKIIFAQLGARLPVGITIEPRKIRGIESCGMICSEEELGLSDSSDGILVLDAGTEVGKSASNLLSLDDIVFELGVTPNRPDVLSHVGVARELAAVYNHELPRPQIEVPSSDDPADAHIKIRIDWPARCSRYIGRVITGVKLGPSPDWVVRRLKAVGQRSISNVVDATNLALLETGHPLHAFDLDKLSGRQIIVRAAKDGEVIKTLDEVERKLTSDDLVIADGEVPVALAGVMGGGDSEVSEGTSNILLEAAMFEPRGIRRTSKRHGLHTEASHRFERGADALALAHAIDRCAALILEMAGGELKKDCVDVVAQSFEAKQCFVRPERAARLLGRLVTCEEVDDVMARLGLRKLAGQDAPSSKRLEQMGTYANLPTAMYFESPSWRVDLTREEDLIEEIARISGYEKIPTIMPSLPTAVWTHAPTVDDSTMARTCMVGLGYHETISLAFNSALQLEVMGYAIEDAVCLANPLGEESAYMRMSLLPAQLKSARLNQSLTRTDLRLFEIGRTFTWTKDGVDSTADDAQTSQKSGRLPTETLRLSMLIRGRKHPQSWSSSKEQLDVFDLKGHLEALLRCFGVREFDCSVSAISFLHPKYATQLEVGGQVLGCFGILHPDVQKRFDVEGLDIMVAELDLVALSKSGAGIQKFKALPKYPSVARDLSFYLDVGRSSSEILKTAESASGQDTLESVELFDVYEGKGLPEGKRSVAIRMTYRSLAGTLKDAQVDHAQESVAKALESVLSAEIRRGA
jgi:phenylalanyl-tRNA synthetase beta chain